MPTQMSVSIVAAPWRRFFQAARWNGQPAQSTTGVASCRASHCQSSNWSAGTIESSQHGQRQQGAGDEPTRRAAVGSGAAAASGLARRRPGAA